jgi:hypothetical protein
MGTLLTEKVEKLKDRTAQVVQENAVRDALARGADSSRSELAGLEKVKTDSADSLKAIASLDPAIAAQINVKPEQQAEAKAILADLDQVITTHTQLLETLAPGSRLTLAEIASKRTAAATLASQLPARVAQLERDLNPQ